MSGAGGRRTGATTPDFVRMRPWFERTFPSGLPSSDMPALLGRLRSAPRRVSDALGGYRPELRTVRPAGRWSIQEHAGHLLDLEPLWSARLDDYATGAAVLSAADLGNARTHGAGHNGRDPEALCAEFRQRREALVSRLEAMNGETLGRTALHPRLQRPMSAVDLCFFVAEHDDHHLLAMQETAARFDGYPSYALDLLNTLERAVPRLLALDEPASAARPGAGRWSPREIVGHLVDSACNNHLRFVRAQLQDDLVFDGYQQDAWVAAQDYQHRDWTELVTLWAFYNRHLAHVMAAVPAGRRTAPRSRHNIDRLSFRPMPGGAPAALDDLMRDYVAHLQHHLGQLPLEGT
jgi:uncharacterized damage-inducible protein DinB